jgi:hypothetical protein
MIWFSFLEQDSPCLAFLYSFIYNTLDDIPFDSFLADFLLVNHRHMESEIFSVFDVQGIDPGRTYEKEKQTGYLQED